MKKALFLHLFDKTLSMEKEIIVLEKGLVQKSCEPWTVKHCKPYLLSSLTSMSEIIYV